MIQLRGICAIIDEAILLPVGKNLTTYATNSPKREGYKNHSLSSKIVQQSRPEELYRRPANPFVADFLGAANILEGIVIDTTDHALRIKINDKILFEIKRNGEIDPPLNNKRVYITFKGRT